MSALSDKLRRAREVRVPAGGYVFTILRPTAIDILELQDKSTARAILPYIIGWEGVTGLDLYSGGDGAPVPFDADACAEWLTDRVDLLGPIVQAAFEAYENHQKRIEGAAKN